MPTSERGVFHGFDIKYCGVVGTANDLDTEHAEVGGLYFVEDIQRGAVFMLDGWHRISSIQLGDGTNIPIEGSFVTQLLYDVQRMKDDAAEENECEIPFTDFDDIIEESDELP